MAPVKAEPVRVVAQKEDESLCMPAWMEPKLAFLRDTESRDTFFARIAKMFPRGDMRYKRIERAYDIAKNAFRDKYRDGGERYFEHLRATTLIAIVHLRVREPNVIVALLLHDIIEDIKDWTYERVHLTFNEDVADLVWWVSSEKFPEHANGEDQDRSYHQKLAEAPRLAILIKVCDRLHNLMSMWTHDPARIQRKIKETRDFILPLAEKHQLMIHELEDTLTMLEHR